MNLSSIRLTGRKDLLSLLAVLMCVWSWLLLSRAIADPLVGADFLGTEALPAGPQEGTSPSPKTPAAPKLPLIAGRPFEEAQAILGRHGQELIHLPGANGVSFDSEGIIVYTDDPTVVPPAVEGLPVRAAPPLRHGPLPSGQEIGEPLATESQRETGLPVEGQCGSEAYWDAALGQCRRHESPTAPDPNLLPPPPGVTILRPGGVREQADACPKGFREAAGLNGWRFCVDMNNPEPLPPLEAPPIAGVPYEEALKILERHREELMKLPGVESVGLDAEGIRVETKDPPPGLPATVEGLPVRAVLPPKGPLIGASHTINTQTRPLRGGVAISDNLWPQNGGTLTTIGLFEGKPWLIFPSHLLLACSVGGPPNQLCPVGTSLANCSNHYGGTERIRQPIGTVPEIVGFIQRWDVLQTGVNTTDAALAFMDNDTVEGNGSLSANRTLELWGPFTGDEASPVVSPTATVTVVTIDPTNSGVHLKPARVTAVGQTRNVIFNCRQGSPAVPLISQMDLQAIGNVCFTGGDSGSPVLDGAGRIIGTFNWIDTGSTTCPGGGNQRGGGTSASTVRQVLGFDWWYGTSVNDNSFGTYRPSQGQWYLDNGDGKPVATDPGEYRINYGTNGDLAVTGIWQQGGERCIGAYRPSQGRFYLDYNCDGVTDAHMTLGTNGDIPVAGDWNNNGVTDLGVWRPSTKTFYLDFNGDRVWGGCNQNGDKCFTYGFSTDKPVAGNWVNSTGEAAKTGVYRPSTGTWYLEKANDGWVTGQEIVVGPFGLSDDKPAIGNWTGVGTKDKIGVFHPTGGNIDPPFTWVLDNGDEAFTSYQREQRLGPFGTAEDQPVAWRKTVWKSN